MELFMIRENQSLAKDDGICLPASLVDNAETLNQIIKLLESMPESSIDKALSDFLIILQNRDSKPIEE